jgi:hypothetical protein
MLAGSAMSPEAGKHRTRYTVKAVAAIATIASTTTVGGAWWYATATPSPAQLALSSPLVDVRSAEGKALLDRTRFRVDYNTLAPHFVSQSRRAYCGVASATMVVNALRPVAPLTTQQTFFTAKASSVRSSLQVTLAGMTLNELADLLRAHDLTVSVAHASQSDLATFRAAARASLMDPFDFLLVNYDRATLHQQGSGHISPVVAYDVETDRFLVLDVASHKYPPTWIPAGDLWNAMNTVDASSGSSRGFLFVQDSGRPARSQAG